MEEFTDSGKASAYAPVERAKPRPPLPTALADAASPGRVFGYRIASANAKMENPA